MADLAAPDAILLRRYADAQDPDAFRTLVERYAGLVYGAALRITADPHDAEDVAQECFMQLARLAGTVVAPVAGWLHKAATHCALNAVRASTRRARREARAATYRANEGGPAWRAIAPHVDAALAGLPDDVRVPLVAHYLGGRNQTEIAAELGVSQPTVSRRISAGIGELRTALRQVGVPAAAPVLTAALAADAVTAAPRALTAALTKMGMVGVSGAAAAGSAVGVAKIAAIAVGTAAVLTVAGAVALREEEPPAAAPAPMVATAAAAEPLRIEADLEFVAITNPDHPWVSTTRSYSGGFRGRPSDLGSPVPGGDEGFTYNYARLGDVGYYLAVGPGEDPVVYFDTNGDREFADESPVPLVDVTDPRPVSEGRLYGPVTIQPPGTGPEAAVEINLSVRLFGDRQPTGVAVLPVGIPTASIEVGGKALHLAVVDRNMNGRYGETFNLGRTKKWDWLIVDDRGDVDPASLTGTPANGPGMHLPRLVQIGDRWFDLEVTPDGGHVSLAETTPEFGLVDFDAPDAEVELWSTMGTYKLRGADGPHSLPVGRYYARSINLRKTDAAGVEWRLWMQGAIPPTWGDFKPTSVKVTAGQTASMPLGGPLRSDVQLLRTQEAYVLVHRLLGRSGESYQAHEQMGGQPSQRTVRFSDEAGEAVRTGNLSPYRSWEILPLPPELVGRFRVAVDRDVGPFEIVEDDDVWIDVPRRAGTSSDPLPVRRASEEVIVDGGLSDWEGIEPVPGIFPVRMEGASFRLCWTDEGLYGVAVAVDGAIAGDTDKPYMGDCVKVFLDPDRLPEPALTPNTFELQLSPAHDFPAGPAYISVHYLESRGGQRAFGRDELTGTEAAWMPTEDGYQMEFFVPTEALFPAEMAPGTRIGFCYAIIDGGQTMHQFAARGDNWTYEPETWIVAELVE